MSTSVERINKALALKKKAEQRIAKIQEAEEKKKAKRLLSIEKQVQMLDIQDEILVPALKQMVQTLKG